jgi:hypothetical protein
MTKRQLEIENQLREVVRQETLRLLREQTEDAELLAGFRDLAAKVNAKSADLEQKVNEDVMTVLSLIASGPFLLELFGGLVKRIERWLAERRGKDPTEVGQELIEFAEKYHKVVMWPFEKLASIITPDKKKQHIVATLLFMGMMGFFLYHAGVKVVDKIVSQHWNVTTMLKLGKTVVTGAEIMQGLRDVFSNVVNGQVATLVGAGTAIAGAAKRSGMGAAVNQSASTAAKGAMSVLTRPR